MRSERGAHRSRRSRTSGRSGHRNAPAPSSQPSRQAASSSVRAAVAQRAPSQQIQRPVPPSNTAERNDAPPLDEMNFPGLPGPVWISCSPLHCSADGLDGGVGGVGLMIRIDVVQDSQEIELEAKYEKLVGRNGRGWERHLTLETQN
ncbi:hypothetical protein DMENIID0001_143620 [Sergentomyia squamirostris]